MRCRSNWVSRSDLPVFQLFHTCRSAGLPEPPAAFIMGSMRHRLFILLLAGLLILATAALQNTAQATPFAGGRVLGDIPLWELRAAIPFGIFTAGFFVAVAGMGAQLLHSGLILAGRSRGCCGRFTGRMAVAALWCGWPFMACCLGALLYIVPAYFIPGSSVQPNHQEELLPLLHYQLYGSIAAMVLCRLLEGFFPSRRWVGGVGMLLTVLVLCSSELLWGSGHGCFLLIALVSMAATSMMCSGRGIRYAGLLLQGAAAVAFGILLQARDAAGVFPTGRADFVCYGISLALLIGLACFKMTELKRRHDA